MNGKKIALCLILMMMIPATAFSLEIGLIGGTISNPKETVYGFSSSFGFVVPLLKFEVEYYNLRDRKFEALTGAVKLRKRFGKLAPYAVLGVGSEFEKISFKFSEYEAFMFVGGGVHLYLGSLFSLRADLRFLNFSDNNKTRLTIGAFFHL